MALPVLRIFHDYYVEWPLWAGSGMEEVGNIGPEGFALSDEVLGLMQRSSELFSAHFAPEPGWTDAAARDEYAYVMRQVVALLRRELDGVVDVRDEHEWCLRGRLSRNIQRID